MISDACTPVATPAPDFTFAEQLARSLGYTFSAEPTGRVQLINPRGEPCGNFRDAESAARSVSLVSSRPR